MTETPDTIHGRMKEGAHLAGYSFQRAKENLRWLLEGKRYEGLSAKYTNVNDFIRDTQSAFKLLKIDPTERKEIAKLIKEHEPEASQRAIADMVGVSEATVNRDLKESVTNVTDEEIEDTDNNDSKKESVTNVTPKENSAPTIPPDDYDPITVSRKEQQKEQRRQQKEQERAQQVAEAEAVEFDSAYIDLKHGDFIDVFSSIPDDSIDLILTDPPYPGEFLPQWSRLAEFAQRVLKPNAFCIAYSGQLHLPEVYHRLSEYLDYYWTGNLYHTGHKQLIQARNVKCGWKPLLFYQKSFKKISLSIEDVITGTGMEKKYHDWQQAERELVPLISQFTNKDAIICDPFAGSGTTLIAAARLGRYIHGAEIEHDTYSIAKKRISDELL